MIKVIASDLDGTLLNSESVLSERTIMALKSIQKAGIRFIVSTGRAFESAKKVLENTDIRCDYIVNGGAEIRDYEQNVLCSYYMDMRDCRMVYELIKTQELSCVFVGENADYRIGSAEDSEEGIIKQILLFEKGLAKENIRETASFKFMMEKTRTVSSFEELEASNIKILKIFMMSNNTNLIKKTDLLIRKNPNIAVVSSFENNLEITDIKAQKGIALKTYIESLGYDMDEVMVLGDSLNDYSMISMDFGMTVAMKNGIQKVKEVAKYITKSNIDDGVACFIEEFLKNN